MVLPATNAGRLIMLVLLVISSQAYCSLPVSEIESKEAQLMMGRMASENEELRRQLYIAQEQVRALSGSLAVANSESEFFQEQLQELRHRMEALGVEALSGDRSKLEQRLLKAVRDLQVLQKEKDLFADRLVTMGIYAKV